MSGGWVVGIDASRGRSGGARVHLAGILRCGDPAAHGIREVHVWSHSGLLAALPERPWLVKHNPPALERSLPHQVWWQFRSLAPELRRTGCHVLLTTDASTVCGFEPAVVMSRDMLPYEPGAMRRYGLSAQRLRLVALRYLTTRALRRAHGALFLTGYAARVIQGATGPLADVRVIPHGVGEAFRGVGRSGAAEGGEVRCLYVSDLAPYKHQPEVVRAVAMLRARGHRVHLTLVGRGGGGDLKRLQAALVREDPGGRAVRYAGPSAHAELPALLARTDLFVFASSCENMPNTLVEGMAAGLPIACADRGPMPEVLGDGGVYFDPEDPVSIAGALERLLRDPGGRQVLAERAMERAAQYSWERCARETWAYLEERAVRWHAPAPGGEPTLSGEGR